MHRIVSIITILLVLFSASYSYAAINYDQKISVYDSAKSQILRNMAENSSYSILENRHYQTISRVSNDNNRNRYYSPALGRFTSKDPIGFAADVNLYRYADGNPVIYIDPFGFVSDALRDIAPERIGEEFGPSGGIGFGGGYGLGGASLGAWSLFNAPISCNPSNPAIQGLDNISQASGNAGGKSSASGGRNSYSGESGSPNGPDDPNWNNGFKKPKPGATGKKGATDIPSWAKGTKPKVGQSGNDFATESMNTRYGKGKWSRSGPQAREYSQLRKYADRHFD